MLSGTIWHNNISGHKNFIWHNHPTWHINVTSGKKKIGHWLETNIPAVVQLRTKHLLFKEALRFSSHRNPFFSHIYETHIAVVVLVKEGEDFKEEL